MIKHLCNNCKALSSIPTTDKKKKEKQKRKENRKRKKDEAANCE
jgi:hypothetical protein